MGKKNSSDTRVRPVFNILFSKPDDSWLPKLLSLPTGGSPLRISADLDFTIIDKGWGEHEKRLKPPLSLLSWLIQNLRMPADEILSANSEIAQKRQDLIDGDQARIQEALNLLKYPTGEDWHIFEGESQPDVFIETPDLLIVIEGKRTESGPTTHTKWMPGRHQMLRHIDCAWEIKGRKQVVGFFIVEGEGKSAEIPSSWLRHVRETISLEALRSSLPHRGPEEQAEIAACFIGATTWQRVCKEFGIELEDLPD